jgi:hypothetical protein
MASSIKITEPNCAPDIVWGGPTVLDELIWRGHADEAKHKAAIWFEDRAFVIDGTQGREEIVRIGKLEGTVDFVQEYRHRALYLCENHLSEEPHKPLTGSFSSALLPESIHVQLQTKPWNQSGNCQLAVTQECSHIQNLRSD